MSERNDRTGLLDDEHAEHMPGGDDDAQMDDSRPTKCEDPLEVIW